MSDAIPNATSSSTPEYLIIGAGPSAICAVARLYSSGIPGNQILWIDPQFKVGDFGTKLSVGSSVPGNTTVESYQRVNKAIYELIPACAPSEAEKSNYEITTLSPNTTCKINIASIPLQRITDNLLKLVNTITGSVSAIQETPNGIRVSIQSSDNSTHKIIAKRVILAIGAIPKTLPLPERIHKIDPNIAFIESELKEYLTNTTGIKSVAVIGSSHSAALAAMQLLKLGIPVKQFMNKAYKFATPAVAPDGTRYTQFDNIGLKGEVAHFSRQLLNEAETKTGDYAKNWQCYIDKNVDAMLATQLPTCTHAVVCIGYKPRQSLQINGLPISQFKHDTQSTQIISANNKPIAGLFGIGTAYPPEVTAISGEVEFAVGVGKFWANINNRILAHWHKR